MCLSTVKSRKKEKISGYGWKVFNRRNGSKKIEFSIMGGICPQEKVLKRKPLPDEADMGRTGNKYKPGFHVFAKKAQAEDYAKNSEYRVVRAVEYNTILARGVQYNSEILIVEEMKVMPVEFEVPSPRNVKPPFGLTAKQVLEWHNQRQPAKKVKEKAEKPKPAAKKKTLAKAKPTKKKTLAKAKPAKKAHRKNVRVKAK